MEAPHELEKVQVQLKRATEEVEAKTPLVGDVSLPPNLARGKEIGMADNTAATGQQMAAKNKDLQDKQRQKTTAKVNICVQAAQQLFDNCVDPQNEREFRCSWTPSTTGPHLVLSDSSLLSFFAQAAHDEGSTARNAVQKALGQGVLVHPVGGASFTDLRKFRNFLRVAQTVWFDTYHFESLTLVWAGNDLGRCEPNELFQAVQELMAFASRWDVKLRLVDAVGSRNKSPSPASVTHVAQPGLLPNEVLSQTRKAPVPTLSWPTAMPWQLREAPHSSMGSMYPSDYSRMWSRTMQAQPAAVPVAPIQMSYQSVLSQTVGPAALDVDAYCSIKDFGREVAEGRSAYLTQSREVVLPPGRPDYGRQIAKVELPPSNVFGWVRGPPGFGAHRCSVMEYEDASYQATFGFVPAPYLEYTPPTYPVVMGRLEPLYGAPSLQPQPCVLSTQPTVPSFLPAPPVTYGWPQ
eukprot:symbB.v1.2.019128.t1/scaffold1545.1/size113997/7